MSRTKTMRASTSFDEVDTLTTCVRFMDAFFCMHMKFLHKKKHLSDHLDPFLGFFFLSSFYLFILSKHKLFLSDYRTMMKMNDPLDLILA